MYIYLDESGDLGFHKEGSSDYFIITLLVTDDPTGVRRCIKRIRRRKLKKKLKELPEIKANNSDEITRKRVLKCLVNQDIEIHTVILDKKSMYHYLRPNKGNLYNYVTGLILTESSLSDKKINLIVDKRSGKKTVRVGFDRYIEEKIRESRLFKPDLKISHFASHNDEGLQAIDFISWSIFRKYELNDDKYYNLIKDRITTEKKLLTTLE